MECDHLIGINWSQWEGFPIYETDYANYKGDSIEYFSYCPLCGIKLEVKDDTVSEV